MPGRDGAQVLTRSVSEWRDRSRVEGEDAKWSDQVLDVVPGDDQVVRVWNLNGRRVKARYLGDGSA
jgi:hypothetical protein